MSSIKIPTSPGLSELDSSCMFKVPLAPGVKIPLAPAPSFPVFADENDEHPLSNQDEKINAFTNCTARPETSPFPVFTDESDDSCKKSSEQFRLFNETDMTDFTSKAIAAIVPSEPVKKPVYQSKPILGLMAEIGQPSVVPKVLNSKDLISPFGKNINIEGIQPPKVLPSAEKKMPEREVKQTCMLPPDSHNTPSSHIKNMTGLPEQNELLKNTPFVKKKISENTYVEDRKKKDILVDSVIACGRFEPIRMDDVSD